MAGGTGERYSMKKQGKLLGVQESDGKKGQGQFVAEQQLHFSHQRKNHVLGKLGKDIVRNGFVEMLESLLMFG